MNQLTLPLARTADPETSHTAADRVDTFRARHEAKIFAAIGEAGGRGATFKEIAAVIGLDPVQVGRRLSAMGERGLIERKLLGYDYLTPIFEKRQGCAVWWVK